MFWKQGRDQPESSRDRVWGEGRTESGTAREAKAYFSLELGQRCSLSLTKGQCMAGAGSKETESLSSTSA